MEHARRTDPDQVWAYTIPVRPPVVALSGVARALGITHRNAEQLARCELSSLLCGAPTVYGDSRPGDDETRIVMTKDGLEALGRIPHREPAELIVNARVKAGRNVSESDRSMMGWHAAMTAQEADLAVTRWWPIPTIDTVGAVFTATIAGFVVHAGRIVDQFTKYSRIAYEVDTSDPAAQAYLHTRIPNPRGGHVVYLQPPA